jgi:hypothetical protein
MLEGIAEEVNSSGALSPLIKPANPPWPVLVAGFSQQPLQRSDQGDQFLIILLGQDNAAVLRVLLRQAH